MVAQLTIDGLRVEYGGVPAVDGVSIDVEAGTTTALLGPSGSGKSTILRAVAGLVPTAGGRVVVGGVDVSTLPPERRGVGLMFQDYALFPHRDVGENVGFGVRVRGGSAAAVAARVHEVLHLVGLDGYERRSVASLSGGQQQRVALARALAPAPALLLLDEPLGSLDRALREHLAIELRDLFRTIDTTVVTVTHDQSEAFTMADTIVLLRDGRVIQEGAPFDVWTEPTDGDAARFLGMANVFAVTVTAGVVTTPWGPIRCDRPDGPASLVVRPDALSFAGEGAPGRVGPASFRGDHFLVAVALAAGEHCEVSVDASEVPHEGSEVQVALDAAKVLVAGP